MPASPSLLGVDTGGTFTDFVLLDGGALRVHKVLSTPEAPERAILQGISDLGLAGRLGELTLIHGSTVATNAVLEGKGVRTLFVTNRGFADLLTLGRQARAALYDLQPALLPPPVPAELCLETGGRLGADGAVVEPLTDADRQEFRERLARLSPEAVAINLLFSWLDPRFEEQLAAEIPAGLFTARSSLVLPEMREYERGIATWLNASVGPLVQSYLTRLRGAIPGSRLAVMQSSGDTVDAERAGSEAVRLLLSGPAGGLSGARFVAAAAGCGRLLTFDMGGTSTDVALLEGEPRLTSEGRIGPWPVAVPMVEMHTIGAGGGSIARVDAGGLLQVGPASAGALPGPACYGRGGTLPTVTDANLVVGRLRADAFLGGGMALDETAARHALAPLAGALGLGIEETALGIVQVANEHMARALRVVSVQRGVDPRGLTLVSFGGAGGLHVCALAEALGMERALVPVHAGVLSALGMLAAARGCQLSRGCVRPFDASATEAIDDALAALRARGEAALAAQGIARETIAARPTLDLRYRGQSYTLNLPWQDCAATGAAFHAAHAARFGHRLDAPVELVNVRLGLRGPAPVVPLERRTGRRADRAQREVRLFAVNAPVAVWERDRLAPGQRIAGPALVPETVATTFVQPGWEGEVDEYGNLHLRRSP
jgi:N-methylhydantoinase A